MGNLEIKVGDRVSYNRSDCELVYPEIWGLCYLQQYIYKGKDKRKGIITKVKTHHFYLIKRKTPLYIIDDYYQTEHVKRIIAFCFT